MPMDITEGLGLEGRFLIIFYNKEQLTGKNKRHRREAATALGPLSGCTLDYNA